MGGRDEGGGDTDPILSGEVNVIEKTVDWFAIFENLIFKNSKSVYILFFSYFISTG